MFRTIDWQQVIHDPRFWAVRYQCYGDYRRFPGTTEQEVVAWYKDIVVDKEDFEQTEDEEELEEGWALSLTFPEEYTWQMYYTTEDEMDSGTTHFLHHPLIYPKGIFLAAESSDDHLPGLRWTELKQIAACLTRDWQDDFDERAIIPLLYPVVQYITFKELEDVRQTLTTVWQDLQVLGAAQAEQWIDQILRIYDKGQILRLNVQKEWEVAFKNPKAPKDDLWIYTGEEGWKTSRPTSTRHLQRDLHQFLPFFSMLERYT